MSQNNTTSLEHAFLTGGGEMASLIAAHDWSRALGPIAQWPQSLKTTVGLMLHSPVPLVLLWGVDGIMLYNDAYSGFAGGAHPRLLGSKVREGWPEVADFNDNVMRVGLAGGTLSYKDQQLSLNRRGALEPAWMDLFYSPVIDESGKPGGVIAVVIEVTERILAERRAEEERIRVTESEARLQMALSAGNGVGTYDWDIPSDRVVADARFAKLYGVDPGMAANGAPIAEFFAAIHPGDLEHTQRLIAQTMQTGAPFSADYRLIQPDGGVRWVRADGQCTYTADGTPLRFSGVTFDITDRKTAEAELRASEAQFRTMAEAMPNHVWTASPDGALDWLNAQVTRYSGLPQAELLGTGWTVIVHPDDLASAAEQWQASLTAGKTYEVEFRLRSADGQYRWHIARAVPAHDAAGQVLRWVGTNTDIQDQKEIAAALEDINATLELRVAERTHELEQAQDALRQAQKMEAVGQLTGGIAHDFNNLLQGITGALDRVQHRINAGRAGEADRFLKAAMDSAARAAALTHRLLAFSRRQTLDPRPTDANRLIGGMEELIVRTVGPNVAVEVVGAAGLWPVRVDPSQLENSLLNLCINARDAMPEGGKLTIETANKWLDDRAARERDMQPGQYVSLCVTDTGTGMTTEVIERAFDPFFTTKPLGRGTGLGLSMIYGFVRQSGGQVRIYSEIGKGTTMCLYFPRHLGAVEEQAEAASEIVERGFGETVLVVDDEPTVRMLIAEVLGESYYNILEAGDGPGALKILESRQRIDLMITDVGLPGGMNGRQVADAARVLRPELKVLFITGYAENAAVGNGHLDPGMEILAKPFAMSTLAGKVREMIER